MKHHAIFKMAMNFRKKRISGWAYHHAHPEDIFVYKLPNYYLEKAIKRQSILILSPF